MENGLAEKPSFKLGGLREIVKKVLGVPRILGLSVLLAIPGVNPASADSEVELKSTQVQPEEPSKLNNLKYDYAISKFTALPTIERMAKNPLQRKLLYYIPKIALNDNPYNLSTSLEVGADNPHILLGINIKTIDEERALEDYIISNIESPNIKKLINFIYMSQEIDAVQSNFIHLDDQGQEETDPLTLLEKTIIKSEDKIKTFLHENLDENDFKLPRSILYAYLERHPGQIKENREKIIKFIENDNSGAALHFLFYIMKQPDLSIKLSLFSSLNEFSRLLMQKAKDNKEFFWLYMSTVRTNFSMDEKDRDNIERLITNRDFYNSLGNDFDWSDYIKGNNREQKGVNIMFAFGYSNIMSEGSAIPVGTTLDRQINKLVGDNWIFMKNDPGFKMLLNNPKFPSKLPMETQFKLAKISEQKILQGTKEHLYHKIYSSLLSHSNFISTYFLNEITPKKQVDLLRKIDSTQLWHIMFRLDMRSLPIVKYSLGKNQLLEHLKPSDFYSGLKSEDGAARFLMRFILRATEVQLPNENHLYNMVRNFLKEEEGEDAKMVDKALIHLKTQLYFHNSKGGWENREKIIKLISHEHRLRLLKLSATDRPLTHASYIERNYNNLPQEDIDAAINGLKTFVLNALSGNAGDYQYNKVMRVINHLHPSKLSKYRGEIISLLSPKQRYALSVYGAEELFTSTSTYVSYLFPAIMKDIQKYGLQRYIQLVDKNNQLLGRFLTVAARYGKLSLLFKDFSFNNMSDIVKDMLKNINADTALATVEIFKLLADNQSDTEKLLSDLYDLDAQLQNNGNMVGERLLESVVSLIYNSSIKKNASTYNKKLRAWLQKCSEREHIFIPNTISFDKLYLQEGDKMVHRQLWLFFEGGDKDGIASRWSAETQLRKAGFKFKTLKDDTRLATKSTGNKVVEIYLSNIIDVHNIEHASDSVSPTVMNLIHGSDKKFQVLSYRGHSTYIPNLSDFLSKSLNKAHPLSIINLGSCGGVSSIRRVDKSISQDVSAWIGTQATGTAEINDLILSNMATFISHIEPGQELNFKILKQKIDEHVPRGLRNKWRGYKFPHENIPAILTMHFNRIKTNRSNKP